MTRKDFIAKCTALGLGASLMPGFMVSCKKDDMLDMNFSGSVLIIGAGSAGLMAGYTLNRYGIDFKILEASAVFGGRVKMADSFTDFPIDVGAEWVHGRPTVFSELIDDGPVTGSIDLIPYRPGTVYTWNNGSLHQHNWVGSFYGDYKFKSSTWYQFFEQYIVPAFSDKIIYDFPVNSIDYTTDQIVVKDIGGNSHMADRVIVTVPLNILKNEFISFVPSLPAAKTEALARTDMPDGLKVFMKFSERFYPDILLVGGLLEGSSQEKIYYNAAFKKDSSENVLALFNVGESASEYTDLGSNEAIIAAVLAELDEIFDGAASANYQSHIVQNWSAEPYIQGSYSQGGDHYQQTIKDISEPVSNKLFFAGDALHSESWSTVQGAGLSGSDTAKTILQSG